MPLNDFTPEQILHYMAYIQQRSSGRGFDVHWPLDSPEPEMVEEGLIEVADRRSRGMYEWATLRVTEYGIHLLEKAGTRLIALTCLRVGDPVLAEVYMGQLKLEDLPEFLTSGSFLVRSTAQRVYEMLEISGAVD